MALHRSEKSARRVIAPAATAWHVRQACHVQQGIGALAENGLTDVSLAMFQMFANLPLTGIISFVGIVLVLVFFLSRC